MGGISVHLLVEDGMIREARFFTDAMEAGLFTVLEQSLVGSPSLVSSITGRLRQKQDMIRDDSLKQVVSDIGALICSISAPATKATIKGRTSQAAIGKGCRSSAAFCLSTFIAGALPACAVLP